MKVLLCTVMVVLSYWLSVAAADETGRVSALPDDVAKLVASHQASIESLHEFDVEVNVSDQSLLHRSRDGTPVDVGTWRWAKSGEVERMRSRDLLKNAQTDGTDDLLLVDVFQDGEKRSVLSGWDWERPVKLLPTDQRGVRAYIEPLSQQTSSQAPDLAIVLLLGFRDTTDEAEPRRSLDQLIRDAERVEVRRLGEASRPQNGTVCMRIWRRASAKSQSRYVDVFLDPSVEMLARKVVHHHDSYRWPGHGPVPWAEWVHEVTKFADVGAGAFFPVESELRVYRSDRKEPTSIMRFIAKRFVVNQRLPEDALTFRFPENALVRFPITNGRREVGLWGPNNRMVRKFASAEQILEADRNIRVGTEPPVRRGSMFLVGMGIGLAFCILVFWWLRSRR